MIAIDTNVLLRYLLADDASQHNKAKTLIKGHRLVLITDLVLAETVWTLTGRRYRLDREAVCKVVRGLFGDGAFKFESSQVVWSALMDYGDLKSVRGKRLDFVDVLIAHKARFVANEAGQVLDGFYSFDKAIGQLEGGKAPGSK
ncbi:MAG: type II toxin-antitoxin system VapC family toxin [Candidatus Thiodiazotropha sp. L084R]